MSSQQLTVQDEVLRPVTDEWSVLLMDSTTIPVVSSFLRTADMLDYGVTRMDPPES